MKVVNIRTEHITLGQLLKYIGVVSTGGEVRSCLESYNVEVNGVLEKRRGRKLFNGDCVKIDKFYYQIKVIQ